MELDDIRELLFAGMQKSQQTSYARRLPSHLSLPSLKKARGELEFYVAQHPDSSEAWKLLSLAYEALLIYPKAIQALETYLKLLGRCSKKDLKKLALYRQQASEWHNLYLTPEQLEQLGYYLKEKLYQQDSYAHSFKWTITWLHNQQHESPELVIAELENRGVFNDFQVLHTIVSG